MSKLREITFWKNEMSFYVKFEWENIKSYEIISQNILFISTRIFLKNSLWKYVCWTGGGVYRDHLHGAQRPNRHADRREVSHGPGQLNQQLGFKRNFGYFGRTNLKKNCKFRKIIMWNKNKSSQNLLNLIKIYIFGSYIYSSFEYYWKEKAVHGILKKAVGENEICFS